MKHLLEQKLLDLQAQVLEQGSYINRSELLSQIRTLIDLIQQL